MKPTLLILAAGIGSRYGGLKQADSIGPDGEALIEFAIYDAIRTGFGKVVIVIRRSIEQEFKDKFAGKFGNIPIEFAFQDREAFTEGVDISPDRAKPWGTGHAMLVAKDLIKEPFLVINADNHYGFVAFEKMGAFLTNECTPSLYGMVGYALENTLSINGSVSRGVCDVNEEGHLIAVNERTKILRDEADGQIYFYENENKTLLNENALVSMNFWGFHPNVFELTEKMFREFITTHKDNLSAEFYIPSIATAAIERNNVQFKVMDTNELCYDITYKEDKDPVKEALRGLKKKGIYPLSLWQ